MAALGQETPLHGMHVKGDLLLSPRTSLTWGFAAMGDEPLVIERGIVEFDGGTGTFTLPWGFMDKVQEWPAPIDATSIHVTLTQIVNSPDEIVPYGMNAGAAPVITVYAKTTAHVKFNWQVTATARGYRQPPHLKPVSNGQ
jgi:hypothetical protein